MGGIDEYNGTKSLKYAYVAVESVVDVGYPIIWN